MDFIFQNDNTRAFFKQDFEPVCQLLSLLRDSLIYGTEIDTSGLNLDSYINFNPNLTRIFISLFQSGKNVLRANSLKTTLNDSLNDCVAKLKKAKRFAEFDISSPEKSRGRRKNGSERTERRRGRSRARAGGAPDRGLPGRDRSRERPDPLPVDPGRCGRERARDT